MENGWKKLFLGDEMPDKDDPRYKERYEREVAAGKSFADASGLSWLVGQLQLYGQCHKKAFLAITFGFVLSLFALNVTRLVKAYKSGRTSSSSTVVARMDSVIHQVHHKH